MALRPGLVRRFISTSIFSSQSARPDFSKTIASLRKSLASGAKGASDEPAADPSKTLFVSGLNKRTTSEKLKKSFSKFGEVVDARVVTDSASRYSEGFVTYGTLEDAAKGIKRMNYQFLDGHLVDVEYARPGTPPGQSSSAETYPPGRR